MLAVVSMSYEEEASSEGKVCLPSVLMSSFLGSPFLTRFNKIAIQATAQMATDKEAVSLSRVHMYLSVSCPYEILVYSVLKHVNTTRIHTIS